MMNKPKKHKEEVSLSLKKESKKATDPEALRKVVWNAIIYGTKADARLWSRTMIKRYPAHPKAMIAYSYFGSRHFQRGKYNRAVPYFQKCFAVAPCHGMANELVRCFKKLGRVKDAEEVWLALKSQTKTHERPNET